MTELRRGTLKVTKKGQKTMVQVLIDGKPFNLAQGQLSSNLTPTDGLEVEFVRVSGQPQQVRAVGQNFIPPRTAQPSQAVHKQPAKKSSQPKQDVPHSQKQTQASGQHASQNQHPRDFHNPYNFIPAPPRNTDHADLGDGPLVAHDAFDPERYSGRIHVRMIVKTPILVPDTDPANVQEDNNGHKTFRLRVDESGLPSIPASSVRGMLRSAYEAITNSRFGRFSRSHQNRLAFRMDARDSLRLIPARIENGQIRLLTGTSQVGNEGRPNGPMYAAWLPRYNRGQLDPLRFPDDSLPQHRDAVTCRVVEVSHHSGRFSFWGVRNIFRRGQATGTPDAECVHVDGYVCITGANIDRKHDERVFFVDSNSIQLSFPLTDAHRAAWRELIENYQSAHEEDLRRRKLRRQLPDEYLGPEPGQTAWSRHVYTAEDRKLTEGTLCYVRLNADKTDVEALFPVMITRELYSTSPWDLLHPTLHPAASIDELSPADRVFGWVRADVDSLSRGNQRDRVAVRGCLRVGPIRCESELVVAVETFAHPAVPLAILAAPKPQQGRFYVAEPPNGEAQQDGLGKVEAGYSNGKGLRGRKVYPYQDELHAHWEKPVEDRTQSKGQAGHYQEYRRPRINGQEQRDDQNRSILGWVKPDAKFTFDLHVQNLSMVELGALLWLLSLRDKHYFRLGGGKPLGFGSVRLTIDECDLRIGHELRSRYTAWDSDEPPADPTESAIRAFKEAVSDAYPLNEGTDVFDDIPFIKAFLVACQGFSDNLPVHYPRATIDGRPGPPSPHGESFKWFVANEKEGARYALRDLFAESGLPTLQDTQQSRVGRGQRIP